MGKQEKRPHFLSGLGLAMPTILAFGLACMQSGQVGTTQDNQTGTSTSAIVPTSAGPIQPGGGSPNATTAPMPVAVPTPQTGAQASMTIASHDAVDLCLTLTGSVDPNQSSAGPVLTLRSCVPTPSQRWVLVNGLLQNSQGGCLTMAVNGNAPYLPGIASCDANNTAQQVTVLFNTISIGANGLLYNLTAQAPIASSASLAFATPNPNNRAGQTWEFGQYSHSDSGAALYNGTSLVAIEQLPTGCVTQGGNTIAFGTCTAQNSQQAWLFLPPGHLMNGNTCLDWTANTISTAACNNNLTQVWSFVSGMLTTGDGNCMLVGNTNQPIIGPCNAATGPHFLLGLSL